MRRARRRKIPPQRFATGAFGISFAVGIVLLGAIGLLSPRVFGDVGAGLIARGWGGVALATLVVLFALWLILKRRLLVWLVARVRDPFRRPLDEDPCFAPAADALRSCSAPLRTRFALGWVWFPAALAVVGLTFSWSTAYFVVDASLARFRVGPEQVIYAAASIVIALIVFRLAAPRLVTWRLATSVHREVTTGYPPG